MPTVKRKSTKSRIDKIPFVLKDNFINVIVNKKSFTLSSSHPTFAKMKAALKAKQWSKVPGLVNLSQSIANYSQGNVEIKNGSVYYRGEKVHNVLADRIIDLVNAGKPFIPLLKFLNNLYRNPSKPARDEFYEWLVGNDLPITDNGCFLAYKSVKNNNTDTHTGKIDNSPGQRIMGARDNFDEHYRTQCSSGYHICSKQYGVYGDKTMAVVVNPRFVLSANSGKMRVTDYEVLAELGRKDSHSFALEGFDQLEKKLVVEIGKERGEMVEMLLKIPAIKRAVKNKKLAKDSIRKASYARLKALVQKHGLVPKIGPMDELFLKKAREAAGISIGQLAKSAGLSYKTIVSNERVLEPEQKVIDKHLNGIAKLNNRSGKAVTYPEPMAS